MGDVVSLVEKAAQDLGDENIKKSRRKFKKRPIFFARLFNSAKTNEKNGWH
jgi:signal recognition particle GTPase